VSVSRSTRLAAGLAVACALATAVAAPAVAAPAPKQLEINYPTFAAAAGLRLNGSAKITNSSSRPVQKVLRLTESGPYQVGSAWYTGQVDLTAPFESSFEAYLHEGRQGADGIAFVLQTIGPEALGGWGGGLGYRFLNPSVAVEFDTFQNPTDPSNNHLAVVLGGDPDTHAAVAEAPLRLYGRSFLARVVYRPKLKELRVFVRTAPAGSRERLIFTLPIDLAATLGAGTAYLGFTGATGSVSSKQDIYSWVVAAPRV
jgi:lectin family protein